MQPRILESDVEAISGEMECDELYDVFHQDYLACKDALRHIPDWLEEQSPDDYKRRHDTYMYYRCIQHKMASWILKLDEDTVSSDRVREKYEEYKQEFIEDNPDKEPDTW